MLLSCFVAAAVAVAGSEATPLATTLDAVSIHPGSALVTRRSLLPEGDGRYVVRGLPPTLDPDSVRLRLDGAEPNDLAVRRMAAPPPPAERLAALQSRVDDCTRAHEAAVDAASLQTALRRRLEGLLAQEAAVHGREVANGQAATAAWTENYAFLEQQLRAVRHAERSAEFAVEDAAAALAAANAALGDAAGQRAAPRFELEFAVVALTPGAHACTLEYMVGGASWQPRYDLRADARLADVALTYRAEVRQQSGEDWRDVDVWLSTAEPRRGVVGPEARAAWLDLAAPGRDDTWRGRVTHDDDALADRSGFVTASKSAVPVSAAVEQEGLSVRYRLPRKETIESRPGATTVLLGHAKLAVTGERVATPALDRDVWIRGRTTNSSDWVLLPGPAAVFFGNDFVGPATLDRVRPGEEFTLHLGRDPGFVVTRTHVEDQAGSAGFFGSRKAQQDRFTIRIEHRAALSAQPDGAVTVQVREVLETAHDDRIEVELLTATPPPSRSDRFARARAESGIVTWELPIARGATATIDWSRRITWPEKEELDGAGGLVGAAPPRPRPPASPTTRAATPLLAASLLTLLVAFGLAIARFMTARRKRVIAAAAIALLAGVGGPAVARAQETIPSRIDRVTVYGDGALVERAAELPGSGTFVLRDLPEQADPASIRVRLDGGEIVAIEVRERRERHLPDPALEALRTRIATLNRELALLHEEGGALESLATHLAALLTPLPSAPATPGPGEGRPTAASWAAEATFLAERLAANQAARREHAWALRAKSDELAAANRELVGGEAVDRVVRDVVLDAVGLRAGALPCTLSYLVDEASWEPDYELRATRDLTAVELTYRAIVTQDTAEPWREVELVLSTAAPQRGAAGPDPQARPLAIRTRQEERRAYKILGALEAAPAADAAAPAAGADVLATLRAAPVATVADEGISERFTLPDRQTITPDGDRQRVLVGRARLPLALERWCVPARDPTVWLRGKAKNESPWTLLPGATAVHLGNDYLGRGTLALTPKGAEAELHLGPDPWLTVERTQLADLKSSSSWSTTGTVRAAWRTTLKNLGAPGGRPDGSVEVIVREALPRARDERIEVELEAPKPKLSELADDRQAREESSLLTWRLALPRGGEPRSIEWGYRVAFPQALVLERHEE